MRRRHPQTPLPPPPPPPIFEETAVAAALRFLLLRRYHEHTHDVLESRLTYLLELLYSSYCTVFLAAPILYAVDSIRLLRSKRDAKGENNLEVSITNPYVLLTSCKNSTYRTGVIRMSRDVIRHTQKKLLLRSLVVVADAPRQRRSFVDDGGRPLIDLLLVRPLTL